MPLTLIPYIYAYVRFRRVQVLISAYFIYFTLIVILAFTPFTILITN